MLLRVRVPVVVVIGGHFLQFIAFGWSVVFGLLACRPVKILESATFDILRHSTFETLNSYRSLPLGVVVLLHVSIRMTVSLVVQFSVLQLHIWQLWSQRSILGHQTPDIGLAILTTLLIIFIRLIVHL